jgi:hypothetical protein
MFTSRFPSFSVTDGDLSHNNIKVAINPYLAVFFIHSFKIIGMYDMRMFENRVLREIFGLKRDEVTGEWRKLHN